MMDLAQFDKRGVLLGAKGWAGVLAALMTVAVLAPILNIAVPVGNAFHLSDYMIALIGKIMCYAICALAMDLIWGYTGILSLGHGLFFVSLSLPGEAANGERVTVRRYSETGIEIGNCALLVS